MYDTYPGGQEDDQPSGVHKVNGIVYRSMAGIFGRTDGEIPDHNSAAGQDMLDRHDGMSAKGVEHRRLAVISGIAHIRRRQEIRADQLEAEVSELAEFREIADLMEEAPGA